MSTFIWTADRSPQKQAKPIVTQIKFGDGYEQRVASGINTNPKNWALNFSNRDVSEIDEIEDFLDARGGVEAFDWTPPNADTAIRVVVRSWTRTDLNSTYSSISFTAEQVFEP